MVILALTYRKLVDRDFKVLRVIERFMPRYEYVPLEVIEKSLPSIPSTHIDSSLRKLNQLKLVRRRVGDYIGYRLTFMGLDVLALKSLVDRGILAALGDKLGVGKESDVYSALTPSDERVIVKFHRLGRTSFQHVLKHRHFVVDKPRYSWLYYAKLAGEREYKALAELYRAKAYVPKPLAYSRHAVVIEYIEGVELYEYTNPLDPESMLQKILDTIRIAYTVVGIVHGDLSEYNIMVTVKNEEEIPLIIDWPQYVEKEHPLAQQLLKRDISYVLRFFKKKYGVYVGEDKALKYVKGESETL